MSTKEEVEEVAEIIHAALTDAGQPAMMSGCTIAAERVLFRLGTKAAALPRVQPKSMSPEPFSTETVIFFVLLAAVVLVLVAFTTCGVPR